jgi:hypothetical protein
MIPDNWWYGHNQVLSLYCGRRAPAPIFGSVVHGWRADFTDPPLGHRRISAAPLFVWNERDRLQAEARDVPNVVTIGAPFAYLAAMLDPGSGTRPQGAGTLCFPYHSADALQAHQDHDRLVAEVEATEPGPYTASIYYQDLDRPGIMEHYEDAGWRLVSFGTRADPMFLFKMFAELLAHHSVVADGLGSALWYAALLGRSIRVLGSLPEVRRGDGSLDSAHDLAARWPDIHGPGVSGPEAEQLARMELGWASMRSPSELTRLLGWRSWRGVAARGLRRAIDVRVGAHVRRGEVGAA